MSDPWSKGAHPSYTAFVIEVHVRRDQSGGVRSFRRLQGPEDEDAASALPGTGGMQEGAWALLTEAARTEAMLQLLVKLSNDAEFKQKITESGNVDPDLLENLVKDTLEQIQRGLDEILPRVARETVSTVRDGLRPGQDE